MKLDDFIKEEKKPWEDVEIEWKEEKLGKICFINPKKSEVKDLLEKNVKVSFVPMEFVDDEKGEIVDMRIRPIKEVYKGYTYFRDGDVLFAKITPCMENGKAAVARGLRNGIGFGSTEFHVLRPKENISSEYIFYYIRRKQFREEAKAHFTGTVGHRRVPKEFVINSRIFVPFRNGKPDLETQRKIVEYIEANFSRIDGIIERKKRELEHLNELWESALEQAFRPKAGEEWKEVKLKKITLPIKKINPSKKNPESEFLYLDIAGIDNSKFKVASYKRIKWKNAPSRARKEIREGDVVFATTRPYLKNIAIVPKELDNQVGSTGFCVLRPNPEYTISKWIFFNVIRKPFVEYISSKMRGTSYPAVLDNDLYYSKIPLPFRNGKPDLEKQKEIAHYLDSVYEKIRMLKEKVQNQISQLEEMKESILEEVFNHGR